MRVFKLEFDFWICIEILLFMNIDNVISALNNPMRRQILVWLKDRSNFPASLPEHAGLDGVCVAYIQEKAGLSQSTISNYMGILKKAGLVIAERHGQWTFYQRNDSNIKAFLDKVEEELLKR